jgi:hypothetical protein
MFLYQPKLSSEDKKLLEDVKSKLGVMPPHFEFLLSLNPKRFQMFIQEITYLAKHPNINPDLFAMLRLHIATKEEFSYCKLFNTKLLLAKGYGKKDIKNIKDDISNIPLDDRHQLLAQKAILAVYSAELFSITDINELKELSWSDSDIYDAIDHACFLFKNAKIIKAYTK